MLKAAILILFLGIFLLDFRPQLRAGNRGGMWLYLSLLSVAFAALMLIAFDVELSLAWLYPQL